MKVTNRRGRLTGSRRVARWPLCVLLIGAAILQPVRANPAASGAAPSPNGRIAFTSVGAEADGDGDIYRIDVTTGRRTNLTRREGYEVGAVVSPDGRTALFEGPRSDPRANGGSIWRMDADGSSQRVLTSGTTPAWSPDGTRIAFDDGAETIFTMAPDGSDVRRLVQGHSPAWSPDGRAIGYLDASSVMIVDPDGQGARRIYQTTSIYSSISWSPDSTRLAVAAEVLLASGGISPAAIVVLPAAGGQARVLTRGSRDLEPQWARDGSRIAFVRAGRIYTVAATGGKPIAMTRPPRGALGVGSYDGHPAWSPDGRLLGFARGPLEGSFRELWVMPAHGGAARRVRKEDVHAQIPTSATVAWSADSRSLLTTTQLVNNDSDIFTVEPDGSGRRQLTKNDVDDADPSFSPDGRSIAFVRVPRCDPINGCGSPAVFVMRADGSGARRLTHGGEELAPSWSPDGSRIVFSGRTPDGDDALFSLYTIWPDGTHLIRLHTPNAWWDSPSWSPDGRSIAVIGGSSEGSVEEGGDLSVVTASGRHHRRLIDLGTAVADYSAWSPSGTRLSFTRVEECPYDCGESLWSVGPDGADPRELDDNARDAAWSPDGLHFVVLGGANYDPSSQSEHWSLRIVSSEGAPERDLGVGVGADTPGLSWQPRCTIAGGARGDRLRAGVGGELVCGFGGPDQIVGGPGPDRLLGGEGDDAIDARGGGFDVVGCGQGHDVVKADRADLVGVDCERVTRS